MVGLLSDIDSQEVAHKVQHKVLAPCMHAPSFAHLGMHTCVRAPRDCNLRATALAKRFSPPSGVKTRRYWGPCVSLARCVRPNC